MQRISSKLTSIFNRVLRVKKSGEKRTIVACKCYAASTVINSPLPFHSIPFPSFSALLRSILQAIIAGARGLPVYCNGFRLCHDFGFACDVSSLVGQLEINYRRVGDNFVGFALRCSASHIAHTTRCTSSLLQNCQFMTNFISLFNIYCR